jgi:hypothetical protein
MRNFQAEWMAAMRCGNHASAWTINDSVLAARDPVTRDDPALPYHQRWVWDGRAFGERHVLVRCYHGLGDTLQYARFLTALRPQVASLTVEVQPEILPLLAGIPGPDRLVPFILDAPSKPSECDIEIMELPHALRLSPDAMKPPYIYIDPVDLPSDTIGLCWQAGGWDSDRSIPCSLMAPLAAPRRVLSLVPGVTDLPVLNPAGTGDMAITAAVIAGLGLVITVDTMVAHLAGALGRPTWLLLKHNADWRWGQDGNNSVWYPSTRLYRQSHPGDWHTIIARVSADLTAGR